MSDDRVTKSNVRSGFQYARYCMRIAQDLIAQDSIEYEWMDEVANELIASAAIFQTYVDQQRATHEQAVRSWS